MTDRPENDDTAGAKAYSNKAFLDSRDARPLRILAEYLEPASRFEHHDVQDTIVFFGSARTPSREMAEAAMAKAEAGEGDLAAAERDMANSVYYEAARDLANRLTTWSKSLNDPHKRFVISTGGGPGIMAAGNQGASEAKGLNVGLNISLPFEQFDNPWISRELSVHFHYFFMRKFWFLYMAKAIVYFPGGFGTMDELFETLTLVQTGKISKPLPLVLFGTEFWDKVVNFDALVEAGTISPGDPDLVFRTDSVEDAFNYLTQELLSGGLPEPGAHL